MTLEEKVEVALYWEPRVGDVVRPIPKFLPSFDHEYIVKRIEGGSIGYVVVERLTGSWTETTYWSPEHLVLVRRPYL